MPVKALLEPVEAVTGEPVDPLPAEPPREMERHHGASGRPGQDDEQTDRHAEEGAGREGEQRLG